MQTNPFFPALNSQLSTLNSFPLSPLAPTPPDRLQPHGHVPIFDRYGALFGWIPQDGPGSQPAFRDPIGFENKRGENLCWLHPSDYYPEGVSPPIPPQIAILTSDGVITEWLTGVPDILHPPSRTAKEIHSRKHRAIIAWLDDRQPPYDPPGGALVG